jgi:hypothetical protein
MKCDTIVGKRYNNDETSYLISHAPRTEDDMTTPFDAYKPLRGANYFIQSGDWHLLQISIGLAQSSETFLILCEVRIVRIERK